MLYLHCRSQFAVIPPGLFAQVREGSGYSAGSSFVCCAGLHRNCCTLYAQFGAPSLKHPNSHNPNEAIQSVSARSWCAL
jgi:hypothetical protein